MYIAAGIIILSAWFTSWSYHYQRLFFIVLRRYLHHGYKELYLLRHHKKRLNQITFAPSRSSSVDHIEMPEIKKGENGQTNITLKNGNLKDGHDDVEKNLNGRQLMVPQKMGNGHHKIGEHKHDHPEESPQNQHCQNSL